MQVLPELTKALLLNTGGGLWAIPMIMSNDRKVVES